MGIGVQGEAVVVGRGPRSALSRTLLAPPGLNPPPLPDESGQRGVEGEVAGACGSEVMRARTCQKSTSCVNFRCQLVVNFIEVNRVSGSGIGTGEARRRRVSSRERVSDVEGADDVEDAGPKMSEAEGAQDVRRGSVFAVEEVGLERPRHVDAGAEVGAIDVDVGAIGPANLDFAAASRSFSSSTS